MSWAKRRGQPSPNPTNPEIKMFNPNQHSNTQEQPYQQWPQQQFNNDWYNQSKPAGKPTPSQPPSQQQQQHYPPPEMNNYWQQYYENHPQQQNYNANLPNQTHYQQYHQYPNNQQTNYYQNPSYEQFQQHQQVYNRQNYYPEQQQQQQQHGNNVLNPVQYQTELDPWDWDWDDNSNTNNQAQTTQNVATTVQSSTNITESFANDESWNWSIDDNVQTTAPVEEIKQQQHKEQETTRNQVEPLKEEKEEKQNDTLEELPSISVLRRIKNDNLTPQWSVESQMSQDSSEDALLTSESDNRSNILSQSSSQSPSRPASTQHDVPPDYTHQMYRFENEPQGQNLEDEKPPIKQEPAAIQQDSNMETVEKSMQNLAINSQFENKEIIPPETQVKEEVVTPLKELPPKKPTPPPQGGESSKNPYKKPPGAGFPHKNSTGEGNSQHLYQRNNNNSFPRQTPRAVDNMGVNLETLPDNSERLDQLPMESIPKGSRKLSGAQPQWAENCEVAPINDRNQYLETGQLSDVDVPNFDQENIASNAQNLSSDNVDSLPPPGLMRLVLGQMEQTENSNYKYKHSNQPPGFTRMVVGGTVVPEPNFNNKIPSMRVVPGESSSRSAAFMPPQPESTVFQPASFDDADTSEVELNQIGGNLMSERSATIGADTPPATNQQAAANTSYSSSSSVDVIPSREGAVGIERETEVVTQTTVEESSSAAEAARREDIEGGTEDELTARNQTLGQNPTDSLPDKEKPRGKSYASDSEHEQGKERHNRSSSPTGRYEKDRRYYERRERDRESPERYKDRKYERRRPKDRRYDDDTDYYSDKERNEQRLRDDREEYDRRYNSLRKDKDRDRRRERGRRDYERDDRRTDYYYGAYEEDYYNMPNRSRPSSRSDSMHESYRERGHRVHEREREHERPRNRERDRVRERDHRPRDPYNSYYQGYNYDPYNSYYQQYQYHYYENLRRNNPQAYAEWCRKYYQSAAAFAADDRASVHSGRSSANEDKDRYTRQSYYSQQSIPQYYRENFRDTPNVSTVYNMEDSRLPDQTDSSLNLEDTNAISQRLTPAKFSTAHVKATISSGHLVNVSASYPLDGQIPIVEIISLQSLLNDEEQKELIEFPGPLLKGSTHKKTVIEYCENQIKKAVGNSSIHDVESYVLMWELLILLLRQNGMVVGTDIAELLMKNRTCGPSRRQSVSSTGSTQHLDIDHTDHRVSPTAPYKEEFVTEKFREYLIYGSAKEALEWAMKHGLWGHALFLASKLDKRTYANVMMRFANGLSINDPLQTLYQLLSGRQPAAVTCVADEKWGDWRPHLAMILSNTTQRTDLDRKAITTLGDTLQSRGSLYAAHFCYLMAQIEFSRYGEPNAKLVLLGASPLKPFAAFATNDAIFMTEIYEYACSLSDGSFVIPEFQAYKFLLASRMAERGLLEKALLYLERVAACVKLEPSRIQPTLVAKVCEMAERLKYYDPVQQDGDVDNRTELVWLNELRSLLNDYNLGLITHTSTTNLTSLDYELQPDKQHTTDQQYVEQTWQQQQQQQSTDYYTQTTDQQQLQQQPVAWQSDQQIAVDYSAEQVNYQETNMENKASYDSVTYHEQQKYWTPQTQQPLQQQQQQQQQTGWEENTEIAKNIPEEQNHGDFWNTAQNEPKQEIVKEAEKDEQRPQISMPNQSKKKSIFDEDDLGDATQKPKSPVKSKPTAVPEKQVSAGWFGGIWSRFSIRPKNQMKLPDDKNPTIVWDSEKKRWVNLEDDNGDGGNDIKPPPKMSDMFPTRTESGPTSLPAMDSNFGNVPSASDIPKQTMDAAPPAENQRNIGDTTVKDSEQNKVPPPTQPNMFKLQRGRNIKKAYVDVFNPSNTKATTKPTVPAAEIFNPVPQTGNQMNYFVPPAVLNSNAPTDFLTTTTGPAPQEESAPQGNSTPAMYNPSQFVANQQVSTGANRGRYGNH